MLVLLTQLCELMPLEPSGSPPSSPPLPKVKVQYIQHVQMPKIELHRPGIEPGPPALQAGTLPKELSTL
jgi:hypothetical protein